MFDLVLKASLGALAFIRRAVPNGKVRSKQAAITLISITPRNIQTIAFIWRESMLGYLSADIICSEKRTVFRERSSRKTESFEEQIMSKDKYPSIFLKSKGVIVFIILQLLYGCVSQGLGTTEYTNLID